MVHEHFIKQTSTNDVIGTFFEVAALDNVHGFSNILAHCEKVYGATLQFYNGKADGILFSSSEGLLWFLLNAKK